MGWHCSLECLPTCTTQLQEGKRGETQQGGEGEGTQTEQRWSARFVELTGAGRLQMCFLFWDVA